MHGRLLKLLSFALSALLLNLVAAGPAPAHPQQEREARRAEKVKAKINRLGIGESARVKIKLRDGRQVKGYIREAGGENFVVIEPKTGVATTIPYAEVNEVNRRGLPVAAKAALGVGIIIGGLLLVVAVSLKERR